MAKLLELTLGAKRELWRSMDAHSEEADAEFQSVRGEVLARDNFSCRFCNFRSEKYQEVHHLDDDHKNNVKNNLVTACPLCHQVHHIGLAGMAGRGIMIALPEITQAQLNQLLITLWVAKHKEGSPYKGQAERLLHQLRTRSHVVESQFAEGASDPQLVGQILLAANEEQYARRAEGLSGIRLMANDFKFERQIAYWCEETYAVLPFESWEGIWNKFEKNRGG